MGSESPKAEVKKSNLLQIAEEDPNRAETPDVSIVVESPRAGGDAKLPKKELNFHELWAHSHWRQFTSLMPGLILLFASGTQIYWTIQELLYSEDENDTAILLWYFGAIAGSVIAAHIVDKFLKSTIYYIGACLLIVSSVFFIKSNIGINLYFGRLLTGVTHGLIHLVLLVHGCDNASRRSRASILRIVSYVLLFGILFAVATNVGYLKNGPLLSNRLIGVHLLGLAVFAVILTPTATNESVPYLISHGREDEALQKYAQLRSVRFPTEQTMLEFDEVRSAVLADNHLDRHILHDGNVKPIVLVSLARITSLCLINIPLLICLIRLNSNSDDGRFLEETHALVWLQAVRLLFGIIPVLYCSALKRNSVLYRMGIVSGLVLLIMISVIVYRDALWDILPNTFAIAALFCYAGTALGIDAIQHVQSAEAFPMSKKPTSLAFIAILEHGIHILMLLTFMQHFEIHPLSYSTLCAIGLILGCVWLHQKMPVSSGLSLAAARDKYKT